MKNFLRNDFILYIMMWLYDGGGGGGVRNFFKTSDWSELLLAGP